MRLRPLLCLILALLPSLCRAQAAPAVPAAVSTANLSRLSAVRFGSHSFFAESWNAWTETVPAADFLAGAGTVFDGNLLRLRDMAAHGLRVSRIEMGWNNLRWDDTFSDPARTYLDYFQECRRDGVRPIVLLNANQGQPGPQRVYTTTAAKAVAVGDRSIALADVGGVIAGHSGMTGVTGYTAMRPVFTALSGHTVTLSQPCPVAIPAGGQVTVSTLKYLPFTAQGSAEYSATVKGWQRYVLAAVNYVRYCMGEGNGAASAFDLECWNELTFGSAFLNAANYGLPAGPNMINLLPQITGDLAGANRGIFSGAGISDGMGNTLPWPASGTLPKYLTAISKHPYKGRMDFPRDSVPGTNVGLDGQPTAFVPAFSALFPEYFFTTLQSETLLRDSSPYVDHSYDYAGGPHGRFARPGTDTPVWITEYKLDRGDGLTPAQEVKAFLRFYCMALAKGCKRACWYNQGGVTAADEAAFGNVAALMAGGLDPKAAPVPLPAPAVTDAHGHYQFQGGGTPGTPTLYDRDCLAFLPFQVSATRLVVPFYVVTMDVAKDLPPESFTLTFPAFPGPAASGSAAYRVYDPVTGAYLASGVVGGKSPALTLQATDTPRLLVVDLPR